MTSAAGTAQDRSMSLDLKLRLMLVDQLGKLLFSGWEEHILLIIKHLAFLTGPNQTV